MKKFRPRWCGSLSVMLGAVFACSAALLSPAPANAQSAPNTAGTQNAKDVLEAKQTFDALFGDKMKAVMRTRGAEDNVALAREVLAATTAAESTPTFFQLLCDKAYEIAITDHSGFDVAAAAMMRLADHLPNARLASLERLIDVRQKIFNAASNDHRDAAGNDLLIALRSSALQHVVAGDVKTGVVHQRRALSLARLVKSTAMDRIRDDLAVLLEQQRTNKQIESLESRVLASPTDVAAVEELVELYLVNRDDTKAAAKLSPLVKDAALQSVSRNVIKRYIELTEPEAKQLADWYDAHNRDAKTQTPATLKRASYYYHRFLELHAAKDADQIKGTIRLSALEKILIDRGIEPLTPEPAPLAVGTPNPKTTVKRTTDPAPAAKTDDGEDASAVPFATLFKGHIEDPKKAEKIKKTDKGFELTHTYIWSKPMPGDGVFAADIRFVKEVEGFCFLAMHLRGGPGGTSYQIAFYPSRDKVYLQAMKGNKLLATLKEVPLQIGTDPLAVKFSAYGDKLKVTVDGKTLFDLADDTYVRATGGLVVQTYNSTAEFHNARYIPANPPPAVASNTNNDPTTDDDEPIKPLGPRKSIFDFCGEE